MVASSAIVVMGFVCLAYDRPYRRASGLSSILPNRNLKGFQARLLRPRQHRNKNRDPNRDIRHTSNREPDSSRTPRSTGPTGTGTGTTGPRPGVRNHRVGSNYYLHSYTRPVSRPYPSPVGVSGQQEPLCPRPGAPAPGPWSNRPHPQPDPPPATRNRTPATGLGPPASPRGRPSVYVTICAGFFLHFRGGQGEIRHRSAFGWLFR